MLENNENKDYNDSLLKISVPYLLRIIGVASLVISVISFTFYTIVSLYQLNNPEFLQSVNIGLNNYQNLNYYVYIQSILSLGLIVSIVMALKLNKVGAILFFITLSLLVLNELSFAKSLAINYLIIYIMMGILVIIYNKRYKK